MTDGQHGPVWRIALYLGLVKDPKQPRVMSRHWWVNAAPMFAVVVVTMVITRIVIDHT